MASFVWNAGYPDPAKPPELTEEGLLARFSGDDIDEVGVVAWKAFVRDLLDNRNLLPEPDRRALAKFIQALVGFRRPLSQPRVFISHRMNAAAYGERIAWLSSRKAGMDYWLDVHDPTLILATAALPNHPRYAAIIAAIIEMALLNCTHVIAAHTPTNPPTAQWIPSQWIPYELGRAKSRHVRSTQAAGWFPSAVRPPQSRGEYVLLAEICTSDDEVKAWLKREAPRPISLRTYHGSAKPARLPP